MKNQEALMICLGPWRKLMLILVRLSKFDLTLGSIIQSSLVENALWYISISFISEF